MRTCGANQKPQAFFFLNFFKNILKIAVISLLTIIFFGG